MPLVLLYQAVGGRNDGLGGAIVLFQLKDLRTRIYLCEIQDIVDVGSPEGVDALRVIAHHTDVLMLFCQLKHNAVLGKVGVLVLVHQNIAELRPIACKHLRTVAEKQEGIEQQIVEIHGIRLPATLPVAAVNIAYGRHLGRTIAFVGFFVVGIAAGDTRWFLALEMRACTVPGLYTFSSNPISLMIERNRLLLSAVS